MTIKFYTLFFYTFVYAFGVLLQAQAIPEAFIIITAMMIGIVWYGINSLHMHPEGRENTIRTSYATLVLPVLTLAGGAHLYLHKTTHYVQAQKTLYACSTPLRASVESIEFNEKNRFSYCITAQLYATQSSHLSFHRYRIVFFTHKLNQLQVGDVISIEPHSYTPIKNHACSWYYMRTGTLCATFCSILNYQLLKRPRYHFLRWRHEIRNKLWRSLQKILQPQAFLLFAQIFGGKTNAVCDQNLLIKQYFKNWGLSHFLARSGAHLVFFLWLWIFLFQALPCTFRLKNFFLMLLIGLYAFLTWLSLSFIRALCMAYITYGTKNFNREPISWNTITLVTFCTLLCNPFHLFFIDFQLSFGFSYALIWFSHLNFHKKILPVFQKN